MPTKSNLLYSNYSPLVSCKHPNLQRPLGVRLEGPMYRQSSNGYVCELVSETIVVNTCNSVNWLPISELNQHTADKLNSQVVELDAVINELISHKKRIKDDISKLISQEVDLEGMVKLELLKPFLVTNEGKNICIIVDFDIQRANTQLEEVAEAFEIFEGELKCEPLDDLNATFAKISLKDHILAMRNPVPQRILDFA